MVKAHHHKPKDGMIATLSTYMMIVTQVCLIAWLLFQTMTIYYMSKRIDLLTGQIAGLEAKLRFLTDEGHRRGRTAGSTG